MTFPVAYGVARWVACRPEIPPRPYAKPAPRATRCDDARVLVGVRSVLHPGHRGEDPGFIDWALEAMIPAGQPPCPRGVWWMDYAQQFSPAQRRTLNAYLDHVCQMFEAEIALDVAEQVYQARAVWPAE
jgi:hypothetical protein